MRFAEKNKDGRRCCGLFLLGVLPCYIDILIACHMAAQRRSSPAFADTSSLQ
jgi:hypothetical protein